MALSSTKDLSQTLIPTLTIFIFSLSLFLCLFSPLCAGASTDIAGLESLKVAPSEFAGSVIDILQEVTSILSKFGGTGFGDFRLSNAVSDCLDLLDLSSDELDWSVSATDNPKAGDNSNRNVNARVRFPRERRSSRTIKSR